ncbi:MAG: VOC family protein [Bacteroidetes bacterium]|nr:VOC family protein [Bacteroidota bacterium]
MLNAVHHIAIIVSDYERSKSFYVNDLGLEIIREINREERKSMKLDLALNGKFVVELFSFVNPPERPSNPESTGLRHLAFAVSDLDAAVTFLNSKNVASEAIRVDQFTGKRFTFIADPDNLPIELYEE